MKRIIFLILICVIAIGIINIALCEDKKDEKKDTAQIKVSGKAVSGSEYYNEQERSSKFFEYRDVPKGFYFKYLDLNVEKGDKFFNFTARNVRQRDSYYDFLMGDYGKYKLDLTFNRIPHRFGFDGQTLYVEPAPGIFTIADQIQRDAQNAANIAATYPIISDFLKGAHNVDVDLQRDKATVDFIYKYSVPLNFNLNVSNEQRKGTRPYGASLGFSLANEVPQPVDDRTTNVDANLQYSKNWGTIRGGYFASIYDNSIESLTFDNYYRFTDRTYSSAYSPGDGTSRGRLAFAPSNFAQKFYFNGSFKLFKSARLNASISFGQFSQKASLLPYTINSAIGETIPNALTAPADSANAKANVGSVNLTFTTKLAKNVHLHAGFNYYNFDNKSQEFDIPGYARFDQVWETGPFSNDRNGFMNTKYFGDVTFNILKNSSIKVGYTFYTLKHKEGPDDFGKSQEGTVKVSFDSSPIDWMNFRVSYSHGNRDWTPPGEDPFVYGPGFNFYRYFEADRNRDAVNLQIDITPATKWDVAFSYMLGNDKYPSSDYGLKKNDFAMYGVDLGYSVKENVRVNAFFYNEQYKGDQASRQSGAILSTSPLDDWTANLKDVVNTAGCGFAAPLKKDKVNLDVYYSYSRAKGTSYLYSPPGGTPDVAVNFAQPLDATTLNQAKVKVTWKITPHFSTALGYWYEQYDLKDIVRNTTKVDMQGNSGGIFLGFLEPPYKYHVGFVNFICTW